jgi:ferrochelatase
MTIGVLLMAYGSPSGAEDVVRYYTDIRRGRPPTAEQLADLERRYEAIGGSSPLGERTAVQVEKVAAQLGPEFVVVAGMKHSEPSIERAVERLQDLDVDAVVGVVLAPHYSELSVGDYLTRARRFLGERRFVPVESWHLHPLLIEVLAGRVTETRVRVGASARVVFTAHSLPARILETGDPYPSQLSATARAVAERLGLERDQWRTAWQSAGRTQEPWLGPDILDVVARSDRGGSGLVVCPAGFVTDHLETLYDLDQQAATLAAERGIPFGRTRALDVDVCPIIADLVLTTTARSIKFCAA